MERWKQQYLRRKRRTEQRQCIYCLKNVPRKDRVSCQECFEKQKARQDENARQRRANGICLKCPNPARIGATLCEPCLAKSLAHAKKKYQDDKEACFAAYGGYVCKCCGETWKPFLSIDHINGGGEKHRKACGQAVYRDLRRKGFPPGFQVLCMNCQFGKKTWGICPHEYERLWERLALLAFEKYPPHSLTPSTTSSMEQVHCG